MSETFHPVSPGRRVAGRVTVPGSKSITNRALVCAALAAGRSLITDSLVGEDTTAMIEGLRGLGSKVDQVGTTLQVDGPLQWPDSLRQLDVRASGTTMRFLAAVASLQEQPITLDGTPRMRERPVGALVGALRTLGAEVDYLDNPGYPPLMVRGPLRGSRVSIDASMSSQFVTALMLVGPMLSDGLVVEIAGELASRPYLGTTAEVMRAFGAEVEVGGRAVAVAPGAYLAAALAVEPDASAAVYPWVGAAITGGDVTVRGLRATSTQADMAVLEVLERMGANVGRAGEVTVRGGQHGLQGVDADLGDCPDGALALAVAAATAAGTSRFSGLHTLRLKETDRLEALATELRKVGAVVSVGDGTIDITPGPLHGADIETYDDHRMAMSFALLGLVVPGIRLANPRCVEKTWPRFWEALEAMAGARHLPVIAIDGPAGTGKTTVAAAVASSVGGARLDTGAFYRAATLLALRSEVDTADGRSVAGLLDDITFDFSEGRMHVDGEDVSEAIRSPEVNAAVSVVSAHPEVRRRLVAEQRRWVARSDVVVVVEGRDIGTVVFPDARCKVYLDAREEVRAGRRALESGSEPSEELQRLRGRDRIDSTREASPLRPAADSWLLDTSDLTVDEVVSAIVARYWALAGPQGP